MKYIKQPEIIEAVKYEYGMEDGFCCLPYTGKSVNREEFMTGSYTYKNQCVRTDIDGLYKQCDTCTENIPKKPYLDNNINRFNIDNVEFLLYDCYIITLPDGRRHCFNTEIFELMYTEVFDGIEINKNDCRIKVELT